MGPLEVQSPGPGGFMGYGDLWGFIFTWFIYNKSMLGFMGIYVLIDHYCWNHLFTNQRLRIL